MTDTAMAIPKDVQDWIHKAALEYWNEFTDKSSWRGYQSGAEAMYRKDAEEIERLKGEAIKVLDWILGFETKHGDTIILVDGEFYWNSDKDGDQPLSPEQLYSLYIKSIK